MAASFCLELDHKEKQQWCLNQVQSLMLPTEKHLGLQQLFKL